LLKARRRPQGHARRPAPRQGQSPGQKGGDEHEGNDASTCPRSFPVHSCTPFVPASCRSEVEDGDLKHCKLTLSVHPSISLGHVAFLHRKSHIFCDFFRAGQALQKYLLHGVRENQLITGKQ